jgi:hypothetical protein
MLPVVPVPTHKADQADALSRVGRHSRGVLVRSMTA